MASALLRALEADLHTLSQDARRSVPAVKDACERTLLQLRSGSASPAGAVEEVLPTGLTGLLHPFILACTYVEAPKRLVLHALSSLQRVVTSDVMKEGDFPTLVRVLEIQGDSSDEEVRLKVLQVLPLLLSQRRAHPDPSMLQVVFARGFTLGSDRSPVIRSIAEAGITQMASLLYERTEEAARAVARGERQEGDAVGVASIAHSCACFLQDMLLVAGGMHPTWMRRSAPIPRIRAADLVDLALREHAYMFGAINTLRALCADVLVPLLLRQLPTATSFPLMLRFARMTRTLIARLHATLPTPVCAVLYLLIRMLHAAAKGEDVGANTGATLNRFGAAGAIILRGAHRMLGASGTPVNALVPPADAAAPRDEATSQEAKLLASVAGIRLSHLPLWKCVCVLEILRGAFSKPAVVCSLFRVMDDTSSRVGGSASRRAVQQCADALWMLVERTLLGPDAAGGDSAAPSPPASTSNMASGSGSGASSVTAAGMRGEKSRGRAAELSPPDAPAARSKSDKDSVSVEDGDDALDEFAIGLGDLDAAAAAHARRPLLNLTCPDAEMHVHTSSVGGLAASITAAGIPTHVSSLSALTGFVMGASVALVSSAVSTGSSLLSGREKEKDTVSGGASPAGAPPTPSSHAPPVAEADVVLPPSGLLSGTLPLLALECLVDIAAAVASAAENADAADAHDSAAAAASGDSALTRVGDLTHVHFAAGASGNDARASKPLMAAVGDTAGAAAAAATAPLHTFMDLDSAATVALESIRVPRALACALASSTWQSILLALSLVLTEVDSPSLCSYILKAYQSFTYACGSLHLPEPRDALLVNLCRMSLPNWQPTSSVNAVASSLLGAEHRSQVVQVRHRGDITAKHLLVLKTLFNIAHCLGGVLGLSWIVIIDTFEQFDRIVRELGAGRSSASGAALAAKTALPDFNSPTGPSLLTRLRARATDSSGGNASSTLPASSSMLLSLGHDGDALGAGSGGLDDEAALAATQHVPDDELGVLAAALATLFEGTVYLTDAALRDLVSALCDLSISALAESATAELAEAVTLGDWDVLPASSGAPSASLGKQSKPRAAATVKKGGRSRKAIRVAAGKTTDVFSVEQAAADDAREIMNDDVDEGDGGDAVPVEDATRVAVLTGSVNSAAAGKARDAGGVASSGGPAAASGMPSSRTAQPPFALTRLMETCAYNAWRLGVVWEPLSALIRVLARSPSGNIRTYGVTALSELAVAHITSITTSPHASKRRGTHIVVPLASVGSAESDAGAAPTAQHSVAQEFLLAPLADYWRSPYADTRLAALQAAMRVVEEAGVALSNPSAASRERPTPTLARAPSASDASEGEAGGWSVIVALLYAVACLGIGISVTGEALDGPQPAASPSHGVRSDGSSMDAVLNRGLSFSSTQPTPAQVYANTLLSSVPRCIFEIPDRHAPALLAMRDRLVAEATKITRLVCDEFLDHMTHASLSFFLLVLFSFSRYSEQMNVALTAVGQIWKISDAVAAWRSAASAVSAETHDDATRAYGTLWSQIFVGVAQLCDGSTNVQLPIATPSTSVASLAHPMSSADRHAAVRASERSARARDGVDFTWLAVEVPSARAEVRNFAIQALFASLVTHSAIMTDQQWSSITNVNVLPLIYQLTTVAQITLAEDVKVLPETLGTRRGGAASSNNVSGSGGSNTGGGSSADTTSGRGSVQMVIHHSRDTVGKQWNETRVLAYQGLVRMLVSCYARLQQFDWFGNMWSDVLAVIERSIVGTRAQQRDAPVDAFPAESPVASTSAEPNEVAVPTAACLAELALLVCVPSGPARPVDDADKYSFDMRVVDGALVRVAAGQDELMTAMGGSEAVVDADVTPAPARVTKLRAQLWDDVRSVLRGVCATVAALDDEEESLAVAVVDALVVVATACVRTAPEDTPPCAVAEDAARMSELLQLLWSIVDARRRSRWRAAVTERLSSMGSSMSLLSPAPRAHEVTVLVEDMAAPRVDIPSNLERSLVRAMEKLAASLWTLTCVRAKALSAGVPACTAALDAIGASWSRVLDMLMQLAVLDDGAYAATHVRVGSSSDVGGTSPTQSSWRRQAVAIPPGALPTQAIRLIQKLYDSAGSPDSVHSTTYACPSMTAEETALVERTVSHAFMRSFLQAVPALASTLLRTRRLADVAGGELEEYDRTRTSGRGSGAVAVTPRRPDVKTSTVTPAAVSTGAGKDEMLTPSSPVRVPQRVRTGLDASIDDLRFALPHTSTITATLQSGAIAPSVYPVNVWGFGLGGSYGIAGDGALVVADAGKAKRMIGRCRTYAEYVITALVAVVRRGMRVHGANEDVLASTTDIWKALITTLESLVGFTPPIIATPAATTPGAVRRAGGSESCTQALRLLVGIGDALRAAISPGTSAVPDVPAHTEAYIAFNACHAAGDANVWAGVASAHAAAASTSSTPTRDASRGHTVAVSLRACVGHATTLLPQQAEAVMRSRQLVAATAALGWRVMTAHDDTVSSEAPPATPPSSAGGDDADPLRLLDAETFLLKAVLDGVRAQLLAHDTSVAFQSLTVRLCSMLVAGASTLCLIPRATRENAPAASHPTGAEPHTPAPSVGTQSAALDAKSLLQARRQRAYARMCMDALVQLTSMATTPGTLADAVKRLATEAVLTIAFAAVEEIVMVDACMTAQRAAERGSHAHARGDTTARSHAAVTHVDVPHVHIMTLEQFAEGKVPIAALPATISTSAVGKLNVSASLVLDAVQLLAHAQQLLVGDASLLAANAGTIQISAASGLLVSEDLIRYALQQHLLLIGRSVLGGGPTPAAAGGAPPVGAAPPTTPLGMFD